MKTESFFYIVKASFFVFLELADEVGNIGKANFQTNVQHGQGRVLQQLTRFFDSILDQIVDRGVVLNALEQPAHVIFRAVDQGGQLLKMDLLFVMLLNVHLNRLIAVDAKTLLLVQIGVFWNKTAFIYVKSTKTT